MWGNPRQSWSLGLWIPRRRFRIPGIGFPLSSASSAKASLCRRAAGAGKKEKESARGTMGTGKRHAPVFSLFPSSFPSFLFFDCCYFYWDIQREPVRRRELDSNLSVNGLLLNENSSMMRSKCGERSGTYPPTPTQAPTTGLVMPKDQKMRRKVHQDF